MVTFAECWKIEEKEKELIEEREKWRYMMKKHPTTRYLSDRQIAQLRDVLKREGGEAHSRLWNQMVGETTAKERFDQLVAELRRLRIPDYMWYKRR